MRRFLAISFLVLFSLPLISPLFALSADADAGLPACCRRNGIHHCMGLERMQSSGQGTQLVVLHQRCEAYPHLATAVRYPEVALHSGAFFFAEIVSHPGMKAQTEALARIALDRGRQKRGPPAQNL